MRSDEHCQAIELAKRLGEGEARADGSYFLSGSWLECCLERWPTRASLRWLPVRLGEREGGALLGCHKERRYGLVRSRVLSLNQSLVSSLDEVFVEYNGFFGIDAQQFEPALEILLERIRSESDWDELRIAGVGQAQLAALHRLAARHGLHLLHQQSRAGLAVDLDAIRAASGDYLSTRSSNTRAQLRRARRQLEATQGPVVLETAQSTEQAMQWFSNCAPWHRARWRDRQDGRAYGGFDNPDFVGFHQALIRIGHTRGEIELCRLQAGASTLAYLYNFRSANRLSFYLGAFDPDAPPAWRPGMLAHWLAIERALAAGIACYDFMAGDQRYKRSLASETNHQHWVVLQRARPALRAEHLGRRIRAHWRAWHNSKDDNRDTADA